MEQLDKNKRKFKSYILKRKRIKEEEDPIFNFLYIYIYEELNTDFFRMKLRNIFSLGRGNAKISMWWIYVKYKELNRAVLFAIIWELTQGTYFLLLANLFCLLWNISEEFWIKKKHFRQSRRRIALRSKKSTFLRIVYSELMKELPLSNIAKLVIRFRRRKKRKEAIRLAIFVCDIVFFIWWSIFFAQIHSGRDPITHSSKLAPWSIFSSFFF